MKFIYSPLLVLIMFSCKEKSEAIKTTVNMPMEVSLTDQSVYPNELTKIFSAHGGLDTWKSKRTISFEISKPNKSEKHTIDLGSRFEKIEINDVQMGSDASGIWLFDENNTYKGDPVFYHNLMFYFYSMPFVVSDTGVNYSEAQALEFEGASYPGIRISYNDGIGLSSKDEYFIHYNPETFQMEWLGYTVTFRSGEKSENIKWIRYNNWMDVDGLLVPQSLTWHAYEGRNIKEATPPLVFKNISFSENVHKPAFFAKPEEANLVQPEM